MGGALRVAALAALFVAAPAAAQDEAAPTEAPRPPTPEEDARARELFELGDRLYQHGQYDAAIDAFDEAYRLSHRPLMLFNLANAQERAGYLPAAVASLEGYVEHAPEDERAAIRNRIDALRARIEAAPGAPEPAPPPEEPTAPVAPPVAAIAPEPAPTPPARGPDLAPAGVMLGVTGALLGAGIAVGAAALDVRAQVDARCARTEDGRHLCPSEVEPQIATDALLSGLTDAALGLAAVGAVVSVYLLADALLAGSGAEREATVRVDAAIGPGAAGLVARGRF